MATGATVDSRERYAGWVAPLCWMAVALEGFDLVVLGVVLPALLNEPRWGLTPNTASLVSVIGLVGVMIGALTVGTISDYIGRRQTMLWTVISFSILTLLCAFAPNPWIFGLLRFLAGLGLGGVLPTALALVNEYANRGNRRATIFWFAAAALFLALLSIKLPGVGIYVSVFLAGVFVFSSQVLVYAYVGHVYPASACGTAMGTASGVGRAGAISGPLIGGWLLTVGLAYPWGFYIFAVVAAIGAVCIALVNRNPAPDEPLPLTEDEADHIGLRR